MVAVGFLGLGAMGMPMAKRLLKGCSRLSVMDAKPQRVEALVEHGAVGTSLQEMMRSAEVIFLSLPADASWAALQTMRQHLQRGHVVVDCSTTSPEQAVDAAKLVRAQGGDFLDAPVSGLPKRAAEGTLTCMIGGEEATCERLRPLLSSMCSKVVHVGDAGHGQLAKAMNNCTYNISIAAMAEMLPLAAKLGLKPEAFAEVVEHGSGSSFGFNQWAPVVLQRAFEPGIGYPMGEAEKDLQNIEQAASAAGVEVGPVQQAMAETYRAALRMGCGELHKGAMTMVHEKRLDVMVHRKM